MFEDITSVENLLAAWREFLRGKRGKLDVQEFGLHLMDNIFLLHRALANRTYRHGGYSSFKVNDPKPRDIHKASVRDRLLHHAVYRILYPYFDPKFIADSFSCRIGKGTHRALARFRTFSRKTSKNNTKQCWILKCDVRKFFASIDHDIILHILSSHIGDGDVMRLLEAIIRSFENLPNSGKGLPLGNLTSQLFANVYMNELDQFVKHDLKVRYYIRYADDFVIFSDSRERLRYTADSLRAFLHDRLQLRLHEDKIAIRTVGSGVDFLGWVHFPDHRVLRRATKRRMVKRLTENPKPETLNSYRGLLKHGNARKLGNEVSRKYSSITPSPRRKSVSVPRRATRGAP